MLKESSNFLWKISEAMWLCATIAPATSRTVTREMLVYTLLLSITFDIAGEKGESYVKLTMIVSLQNQQNLKIKHSNRDNI